MREYEHLTKTLRLEEKKYLNNQKRQMKRKLHIRYCIWKYIHFFRLFQYWMGERTSTETGFVRKRLAKYSLHIIERRKNLWSIRSGVEIGSKSCIGAGVDIWHSNVIINGTVGDDCIFHGNNVIGKKGDGDTAQTPVLGNRVDVGAGAIVIGGVRIADDSIIGAGAVVTKSFDIPGSVIVGVPGKLLIKNE